MIPSRWPRALWWLLFISAFAMVSTPLALLGRAGSLGWSVTALISLAIVVPLVIYLICRRWRADARYDAVTALLPSAYVVEGIACDPTAASLFSVGGANASEKAKRGYTVAVDRDGVRFYEGGKYIVEFLRVAWTDVESVELVTVAVASARQATALELAIAHEGESTKLPIAIKATQGLTGFRFSSPPEMHQHLKAFVSLRSASQSTLRPSVRSEAVADEDPTAQRQLVSGMSSVGMSRFAGIAFLLGLIALFAMLPFGILTWTHIWAAPSMFFLPFILVALGAIGAGRMVGIFVPMRESAELRAGYTLSRDGDINVDQLDPKTGYVIRPAGLKALSRVEEKRAIVRVRASAANSKRQVMGVRAR